MFKDALGNAFPLIEKIAPTLATAIGSPAAGIATSVGINLLASAFGINNDSVKDLGQVIVESADSSHTECTNKLEKLENKFSDWFKNSTYQSKMPKITEINIKLIWDN